MPRKIKTKATDQQVITSQEEFINTLDQIARLGVKLDTLQATKETAVQKVLTEHDPEIKKVSGDIDQLTKRAEQWASPRRDELFSKGKKSASTALTTYGYRLGNPSLKPAKGWTWDKVTSLLKSTRRKAYLVTKTTPNKDAIRLHVKPHKLAKLGMEIKQEETFFVERKTEEK
ncbi:host-nuclease inhibitor Gam family protein [Akkermansia sp. Marseille-P9185]|jgi:bacteriophage Mu gam like protein|uniref:host-nuclease inhibitor Gam family protein n=1 Tax=Akkermansia massiliensis TaxID=2927224 RepID=UPI00202E16E2|nr:MULTISPECIES: host-nuclease inhibitor Gam family protein [Akkermansia]MCM0684722.1 host-nuclease inhibitor Gam family protein [Akkermansia sp. B2-R-115]MCO8185549.1 host-nuclease inhibitor Gam family protein [Akkermansia massiliensis]